MRTSFVITFDFEAKEGFDLALIGSSFIGFDRVIKELLIYAGLSEKIEVRTTQVRQGSVEVLNSILTLDPLFIQDPRQLIDFLKIAEPALINGLNTFLATKNDLNEYYAKNPLDFEISLLITAYIINSIRLAGIAKRSEKEALKKSAATPRQIKRLHNMVKKGHYKKALAPITHGSISSVGLKSTDTKTIPVLITPENVGDFLPDEDMILPEFTDGDLVNLTGELQLLGSTHGDSMKIKIRDINPEHCLLDATLGEGLDILNYRELFKQAVFVRAEIKRESMFKRPTLEIDELTSLQEKLDFHS